MFCVKCHAELPDDAVYCHKCGKKQTPQKRKALKRANGMGTVYKLQGRRKRPWIAARSKVVLGYFETKTAALEALERTAGRDITERYNMTFAEVFAEWKEEHYKELTKSGIAQYNRAYQVFESLHNKKFRTLRTADFQGVIDQHMSKTHSTVSKYKQLITQMSTWAMREEIIVSSFAQYVRIPEKVRKEKEIFTDCDIKKMRDDGSESAMLTLMMIYTGMRIGELFSLQVEDCHGSYVVGGEKTEAGRNRIIPIAPDGREYFDYFVRQATGPDLVSGYTGNRTVSGYRNRDYYSMLERLGIPKKSPHAARHTYASRARKAGIPPEILQKVLGHADYSTTANIYVHTDAEDLVKEIDKLSEEDKRPL